MLIDESLLAVIQSLYDAALEETLWPKALRALIDATDSQAASFWVLDSSDQPRLPIFTSINFDPKAIEEYLAETARLDPTVQYLVSHPTQTIVHDGLVITEREKDRHPYYDWHEQHIDTRFRLVGQVHPAPSVQAGIALHRTRRAGRYEPADLDRFAFLYRHLEKALAIGFRLGSLTALQQSTIELLDHYPAAVLFLDCHKRLVYANRSAEKLRFNTDGICLSGNQVIALRRQDHERLQTLIVEALAAAPSNGICPGGVMRAMRPSGKRPYTLLVVPVSRRYPALSIQRPAVCIVITDPDSQSTLPEDRIGAAFCLTHAESRLAALLANGVELHSAAAQLKITYGTARTRLAVIFEKTDTRRQGELVKLLLTTFAMPLV